MAKRKKAYSKQYPKRGKRPTSAQARKSGSNLRKRPKKTGTNRTVGTKVMKKSRRAY